jgi:hypothetical protein
MPTLEIEFGISCYDTKSDDPCKGEEYIKQNITGGSRDYGVNIDNEGSMFFSMGDGAILDECIKLVSCRIKFNDADDCCPLLFQSIDPWVDREIMAIMKSSKVIT